MSNQICLDCGKHQKYHRLALIRAKCPSGTAHGRYEEKEEEVILDPISKIRETLNLFVGLEHPAQRALNMLFVERENFRLALTATEAELVRSPVVYRDLDSAFRYGRHIGYNEAWVERGKEIEEFRETVADLRADYEYWRNYAERLSEES